ncbi:MAG TPA: hypothetical protein VEJ86_04170 [Candidatus Binataceae bacterium]|nr:hypothetical protein [Candidatus Binataceae bacterium]
MSAVRQRADWAVIAAWTVIFGVLALLREDYAGDGIRHLAAVLERSRPALREPRWLGFLALQKPHRALGMSRICRDACRAFAIVDVAAGRPSIWASAALRGCAGSRWEACSLCPCCGVFNTRIRNSS